MHHDQSALNLKPLEALIVTFIILGGISYSIIFAGAVPHIPVVFAIMGLIAYGLIRKVSITQLEKGLIEGAQSGLGAIFIFFLIGMLISSWMASGTIPTFIYMALEVVNGEFFYAIVFVVASVIGMSIGSSLTTAATLGVAFMGVSSALGLSDAITAGAVISGAFFGDKMSPYPIQPTWHHQQLRWIYLSISRRWPGQQFLHLSFLWQSLLSCHHRRQHLISQRLPS